MQIEVKLYGPFCALAGRNPFLLDIGQQDISVEDFLGLLSEKIPGFRQVLNAMEAQEVLKQRILLLVNGKPCADHLRSIRDGDQLQILTPVAGG